MFSTVFNDGSAPNFSETSLVNGGVEEAFIEDNYRPTSWLTLIGGERQTHFQASISENAIYPRIGVAVQIPKLGWVFRGFYGHFYQPPPLTSLSGPGLTYAQSSNTSFVPLRGERDEEHQFGLQIPWRGWLLDADTFQTRANNFLDHSNIGESSIFIPVTVQGALIQGWELTLHSPRLWRYGQAHVAYSNQIAQQIGPITGGLICYPPGSPSCAVAPGYSALDHDQRNTLNMGFDGRLPRRAYASFNVYYGSGFSNGYSDPAIAIFGRLPPRAHHLRPRRRQRSRRKLVARRQRHQRRQHPSAARQQPHLRRLPRKRSTSDLRGGSLPFSLLKPAREINIRPLPRLLQSG